jgi:hypothetical protein
MHPIVISSRQVPLRGGVDESRFRLAGRKNGMEMPLPDGNRSWRLGRRNTGRSAVSVMNRAGSEVQSADREFNAAFLLCLVSPALRMISGSSGSPMLQEV